MASAEPLIVVLAVDPSEHSEFTFKWYLKHIHRPHYALHLVHVPEYQSDMSSILSQSKANEALDQARNLTECLKDNYLEWASQHGVPDAKFAHPQGSEAWHEIIKYAENVKAGLIVIGSRGLSKLKRTFMGSVSDSVLHHSHVPVLVCRKKDAEV